MDLALRPWGSPGEDTGWVAVPSSRAPPCRDSQAELGGWLVTGPVCHLPEDGNWASVDIPSFGTQRPRSSPAYLQRHTAEEAGCFPRGLQQGCLRSSGTTPSAGHTQTSWGLRGAKDNSASQDGKRSHRRDGKLAPWRAGPAVVRASLPPHPPREKWMRS